MKANAYFYRSLIFSGLFTFAMLCDNPLYAQFGDNLGKHKADRALDMNAKNLTNVALLKYKTLDVADVASGGDIGAAAATVDLYTAFQVTQATAGQDLTLPAPTTPTVGQMAYVKNTGTASFTMYVTTVAANAIVRLTWNGTAWAVAATGQSVNALAAPTGANANGGSIAGNTLTLSFADDTNPGLVSTGAQTIAGAKTFSGNTTVNGTNTFSVGTGATSLGGSLAVTGNQTNSGNITQSGATTFSTGTGAVSLNGNTTLAGGKTLALSGSTSGTVTLQAAATAGSAIYTLPSADGDIGNVLSTNGSGTLSWKASSSPQWYAENAAAPTIAPVATGPGSVAFGEEAKALSDGMFVSGNQAGYNATAASYSVFMGHWTGNGATNAANSNFMGSSAGANATAAHDANFLGTGAGSGAANARYSTFMGFNAGKLAQNANHSVFIGREAGSTITNGAYSVLLGFRVGSENENMSHMGTNNIVIGNNISVNDGFSNAINIGGVLFGTGAHSATDADSDQRFLGAESGGKIGIGVSAPTATLHIAAGTSTAGTAPLKLTAGTNLGTTEAGAVEYDGSHLYFTAANAGTRYQLDQQGGVKWYAENAAAPTTAPNATGSGSIAMGNGAVAMSDNSFVYGNGAGPSTATASSAMNSNFIGQYAGSGATNATRSNFFGQNAGSGATGADYSNFLGFTAGQNTTNANNSNFLGSHAGDGATSANNSNFFGLWAGSAATGATNSNFFGQNAGSGATGASFSNLFGYNAGNEVVSGIHMGGNNIVIGTNISLGSGVSNAINIGGVLFGTGTYSTTTGNPSTAPVSGGKIGIGTNTPTAKLDVVGDVKATRFISAAPATIVAAATTDIDLSTGNHFAVSVDTNITTLNLTNAASSPATIILKLIYSDTGTYTIEWPASFKWSGGAAPALTGVSGKTDVISLIYDGTSTYYCTYALNF